MLARVQVWAGRKLGQLELERVDEPLFASVMAVAEQIMNGKISVADAKAALDQPFTEIPAKCRGRRMLGQIRAEFLAALGAIEPAVDSVVEAVDDGLADVAWFDQLRLLDRLRADPRFARARETAAARSAALAAALDAPLEG